MKAEKGQSTVELALSLMILILLLFGIVDFGRVFYTYLALDHAGREGARAVAIGKTDTEIIAVINSQMAGLDTSKLQINIDPSENARIRGVDATVTLSYQMEIITPIIAQFFPQNPFPLNNTTVMRMEN